MNVELHGFSAEQSKSIRELIWSKLQALLPKERFGECIITSVPSETLDYNSRSSPFIRVFSRKARDFETVTGFIRSIPMPGAGMRTRVEFVMLSGTFELNEDFE